MAFILILTTWTVVLNAEPTKPPVTLVFLRGCGPADGRIEAYDPRTQQYHLKLDGIARFRVGAVADDLRTTAPTRPVVLRISGMLDRPEGPLTLETDGKSYRLHHEGYDKALFRVERNAGVTTIEFLPGGIALLKPGATFQYIDHYRG